ncbi:MAG: family 43 glycosylhydrolase [Muribaculaceae bacterium]|nr:family 43 glycosylhydrolase [Muribaculaceae bacterium]
MARLILIIILSISTIINCVAETVVRNGVPWFDTDGNIVNAHGACIVEDGGKYWLFGEYKSDESNAFPGFGCYSSPDLVNWKFERVVLPVQPDGILGPERVGERVKVMRCPSTGEYVMFMHADDMKYKDPHIGIAVCGRIDGDYNLLGTIEYNGEPIKRWDMGTFQDEDGTGYLLIHHGPIYRLSKDYRSIEAQVADIKGMGESPAMFKKDGTYYLLTSHTTSWERNDNYYYTATSIEGPWEKQGLFCPEGSLTYNSQCTFVFPLNKDGEEIPMYMGDRWSFPHQASAATCVWLPMQADGNQLSIPEYWQAWNIDSVSKSEQNGISSTHSWTSNTPGDKLTVPFKGKRISVVGKSNIQSGYARIRIKDKEGNIMHDSLVDFYSKVEDNGLRFVSKVYPEDEYILEVEVAGENPIWFNKRGDRFGSTDFFVNVTETIVE